MARILIVTHAPRLARQLASTCLDGGHCICVAPNGRDAYRQVTSVPFDLVLVDARLPLLGCLTLAHMLRDLDVTAELPVVCVASSADDHVWLTAKVDAIVYRSAGVSELCHTLDRVLSRSQKLRTPVRAVKAGPTPTRLRVSFLPY